MSAFTKRLAAVLFSHVLENERTVHELEAALSEVSLEWRSGSLFETITDHERLSVGDLVSITHVLGGGALDAALKVIAANAESLAGS